jgi:hypothetical protein
VREVVRVTATAVWSQGWWTIRLVGAPEINAQGATPGPGSCRHRRSPGSRSGTRRRRCAGPHPLVRRRRFDLIAGPSSRQRVWGISAAGTTVLVGSASGVPVELLATAALSHRLPGRKGVVGSEGFERDAHASQWPLRTWGTSNSRPGRRTSPGTHTRRPRTFRRGSARAERGQVKRPVQMKSGVAMGVEPVARPHASGPELLCARGRDAIAARSMRGSGLDVIPIAARTMLAGAIRLRTMMRGVDGDDAPLRTRGAVGRRAALPAGSWCEITATTAAAVSYEPVLSRAWLIVRKPYRPGHDPGACSCASNQCAPSDRTPDWRPEGLRPLRASPRLGALWSAGHAR